VRGFHWICGLFLMGGLCALGSRPLRADAPLEVAGSSGPAAGMEEAFVSPLGAGKGKIVSRFGKRQVPGLNDPTKTEMHEGVDMPLLPGDPIKAARSGKVLFAGFSKAYVSRADKTDQAHLIIIRHADGKSSRYVHLNALRVRPGAAVTSGQVIGTGSESDECTVPVLHFEIRDPAGKPMDPEKLLTELKK
jgi:murein DD-endopeptidase MepM/ murein hydrolase activator NlpD